MGFLSMKGRQFSLMKMAYCLKIQTILRKKTVLFFLD